jgi:hypothetical protein
VLGSSNLVDARDGCRVHTQNRRPRSGYGIGRQIRTDQAVQGQRLHERVNASARPDPSKATSDTSMGRQREVSADKDDVTLPWLGS